MQVNPRIIHRREPDCDQFDVKTLRRSISIQKKNQLTVTEVTRISVSIEQEVKQFNAEARTRKDNAVNAMLNLFH